MKNSQKFPGVWKRFFALIIDTIIISLVGVVGTYPLSRLFESDPKLAHVAFFLISVGYFFLTECTFLKGQSLGKKLLGIKVVNNSGDNHSFSFLGRKMILFFLFQNTVFGYLGLFIKNQSIHYVFEGLFFTSLLILGAGILVMPWFHPQKRGLHDILFGTEVVYTEDTKPLQVLGFTKSTSFVFSLGLLLGVFSLYNTYQIVVKLGLDDQQEVDQITKVQTELKEQLEISEVVVHKRAFEIMSFKEQEKSSKHWVNVTLFVPSEKLQNSIYKEKLLEKTELYFQNDNTVFDKKFNKLQITLVERKFYGVFEFKRSENSKVIPIGRRIPASETTDSN